MQKPKQKESRKDTAFVVRDLQELQASKEFQSAVLACNGDVGETTNLCYQFNIGDTAWMRHVIQKWDGKSPLPRSDDSVIRRKWSFSPITLGYWDGNFFASLRGYQGGEDRYVEGSPRLRAQAIYQRDDSGGRWLTLRMRLTPDLSVKEIGEWVKWATAASKKNKKPSLKPLAFSILESDPKRLQNASIYKIAQYLRRKFQEKGIPLSESQSKSFAKEWKDSSLNS